MALLEYLLGFPKASDQSTNEIVNFTKNGENENDLVTMVGSVGGTLGIFIGFSKPKAPIDNQNR